MANLSIEPDGQGPNSHITLFAILIQVGREFHGLADCYGRRPHSRTIMDSGRHNLNCDTSGRAGKRQSRCAVLEGMGDAVVKDIAFREYNNPLSAGSLCANELDKAEARVCRERTH